MITLANVTTTDNYKDATLGPVATCQQIRYLVANKPVLCQIMPSGRDLTERSWGQDILVTPESNVITRCQAIRFKSAVSGVAAQVIAQLIEPGDPVPTAGTPFAGTLSAAGGVTPGASSVQVQIDGTLVATEPILDFVTGLGIKFTGSDDVANTRTLLTIAQVALADTILAAPAASIDIQNIPQTYAALRLLAYLRDTNVGVGIGALLGRFNNDAGANYDTQTIIGQGGAAPSDIEAFAATTFRAGLFILGGSAANLFAASALSIPAYAQAVNNKIATQVGGGKYGVAAGSMITAQDAASWRSNAAINRLTVFTANNLAAGGRATLLGDAGT